MTDGNDIKCGFVAIIGAPNAGKSTLMNSYLGVRIAATSHKPQTTRTRILGVLTRPGSQLIFIDTPGIHQARSMLNKAMVEVAVGALGEVDAVLWVIDAAQRRAADENLIREQLDRVSRPLVLALNKVDLIKPHVLLPEIEKFSNERDFKAIVPISALNGDGLDTLAGELTGLLPQGPALFPEDSLTDQPERVLAAEMVREKVFRMMRQEVPYGVAVSVEEFTERPGKDKLFIRAVIHVERDSQKGIIIGAKGAMIKKLGSAAREELEKLFNIGVFLELAVKVERDWTRKINLLREFGYRT